MRLRALFETAKQIDEDLFNACLHNDYHTAKFLIKDMLANVNCRGNADGETALHIAVNRGYINIIDLLLKKGADVTLRDNKGRLAVDRALYYDAKEIRDIFKKYHPNDYDGVITKVSPSTQGMFSFNKPIASPQANESHWFDWLICR